MSLQSTKYLPRHIHLQVNVGHQRTHSSTTHTHSWERIIYITLVQSLSMCIHYVDISTSFSPSAFVSGSSDLLSGLSRKEVRGVTARTSSTHGPNMSISSPQSKGDVWEYGVGSGGFGQNGGAAWWTNKAGRHEFNRWRMLVVLAPWNFAFFRYFEILSRLWMICTYFLLS